MTMNDLVFVAALGRLVMALVLLTGGALAIAAVAVLVMQAMTPETDEEPK